MKELQAEQMRAFQAKFDAKGDILSTVAETIGGTVVAGGIWRFFGKEAPLPGIFNWNDPPLWKKWWGNAAGQLTCIGEDVFGNQIVCVPRMNELLIWDHESAALCSTQLTPDVVMEVVF